jgi:cell shape-determining protein MreC
MAEKELSDFEALKRENERLKEQLQRVEAENQKMRPDINQHNLEKIHLM